MKKEDLELLINNMQEKLGEENSGVIADDFATLITENTKSLNEINNKDDEITKLKNRNELLTNTNANLLLKVSMGEEPTSNFSKTKKEEKEDTFSFKNAFDEKGNFIK